MYVKPKKKLGQHFLTDELIAQKIADTITVGQFDQVVEIGAGTGMLTKFLLKQKYDLTVIEIDTESVEYLNAYYPELKENILSSDFLKLDFKAHFPKQTAVIGNYPYNISSQILFKMLENKAHIPILTGMFQKETAHRVCAGPGGKVNGILSILIQAYYTTELLFNVPPTVFNPPPKVESSVIRLVRREKQTLDCNEKLFFRIVKTTYNQRRKTLRNSLRPILEKTELNDPITKQRPEQLSVQEFVYLTNAVEKAMKEK